MATEHFAGTIEHISVRDLTFCKNPLVGGSVPCKSDGTSTVPHPIHDQKHICVNQQATAQCSRLAANENDMLRYSEATSLYWDACQLK